MKKSSSAPNLARLHSGKSAQPAAAAAGLAATARRATGSSTSLTSIVQDDAASKLQPRRSFGGATRHLNRSAATTVRRPSGSKLTQAAYMPPPPQHAYSSLEQVAADSGKWFLEGASHGIASTDCFSLFGYPSEAPNLRDDGQPDAAVDSSKDQARKAAEAACLLSPASGQERDAGSQLRSVVQRAELITQMQTQMRFDEEVRRVTEAETLHMARQVEARQALALRAANSSPRYRRERRKGATRGDDPFCTRPGEAPRVQSVSPRTALVLAEWYGKDAAVRNTRSVDEDDWAVAASDSTDNVAASIGLPHPHTAINIMSTVDLESPQDSSRQDAAMGHFDENTAVRPPSDKATATPKSPFEEGSRTKLSIDDRSASAPAAECGSATSASDSPGSAASAGPGAGRLIVESLNGDEAHADNRLAKGDLPNDDVIRKKADNRPMPPRKHDIQEESNQLGDDKENSGGGRGGGGGRGMSNAVPFVRRARSEKGPTSCSGVSASEGSNWSSGRFRL